MNKRTFLKWTLLGAISVVPIAASFGQALPASGVIPDQYIVVLKPGADHARVVARHGLVPDLVYSHALKGFAGKIPPGQLRQLLRDADVVWIEPDQVVTIVGVESSKGPKTPPGPPPPPSQPAQVIPTGISRIGAYDVAVRDFSAIGIAIIDTGIDLTHPDLNVAGNVSFVPGISSGNDDNGHGTHCAGIAAAINNGIGVVGVAPKASLYAVKVLKSNGSGQMSWVIAGVNWVKQNANTTTIPIKVANMSLGGGNSPSLNLAITNSVNVAGVAYCVAAGNDGQDASSFSPANCGYALAVSAIVDTDGMAGHLGGGTDDTFASFSNYGSFVHIAAPGVNILSTYKGGRYAYMSGTSMAAPHVTGAAARYIAMNPGLTPNGVYLGLIAGGEYNAFSGDPDSLDEPLVNVTGL